MTSRGDLMFAFSEVAFHNNLVSIFLNMADELREFAAQPHNPDEFYKADFEWGTVEHTLYMLLVSKFGDYAVSPRTGWITHPEECADAIYESFDYDFYNSADMPSDEFSRALHVMKNRSGKWEQWEKYNEKIYRDGEESLTEILVEM